MPNNLRRIDIENFGPIRSGSYISRKIDIFFGRNNSGKSILARLIHGILSPSFGTSTWNDEYYHDDFEWRRRHYPRRVTMSSVRAYSLLKKVNSEDEDLITHKAKTGRISISTNQGNFAVKLKRADNPYYDVDYSFEGRAAFHRFSAKNHTLKGRRSVYIPAARTGTLQSFNNLVYMRNQLLRGVLSQLGGRPSPKESSAEILRFLRSRTRFPLYLEDFYDLILEFMTQRLMPQQLQEKFGKLYDGSLQIRKHAGLSSVYFRENSGFITEMENAGSGVIASFPILLGLYKVANGGTLIVEEPEAHIEPARQMTLVDLLCEASKLQKLNLVLTTHSEWVYREVLALVAGGMLKPSDVGLHFFDRTNKASNIRRIEVDERGAAEQPVFDQASNSLMEKYSESIV